MKYFVCLVMSLLFVFSVVPAMAADQSLPQKGEMSLANMTDQELASVRGGYVNQRLIIKFRGFSYDQTNPTSFVVEDPDPTDNRWYKIRYIGFVRQR